MYSSGEYRRRNTIDEARIRDHLGEMVRGTVEETLNAMLDAEARPALRRRALRAQPGSAGYPGRKLRTLAADPGWRSESLDAEFAAPDF